MSSDIVAKAAILKSLLSNSHAIQAVEIVPMAGETIATLPAECTPRAGRLMFNQLGYGMTFRVDVAPDAASGGAKIVYMTGCTGCSGGSFSLSGIAFLTDDAPESSPLPGLASNGWEALGVFGDDEYAPPSFTLLRNGVCVVEGVLKKTAGLWESGASLLIGTLPVHCRPTNFHIFDQKKKYLYN